MSQSIIKRPDTGRYISIEGIEGSGKSYYIEKLKTKHPTIHAVSELSNKGFGKSIKYLLSQNSDEFFRHGFPVSEALLFFSMKLFNFEEQIIPALIDDKLVVEDRSVDTNALYSAVLMEEKYGGELFEYYDKLLAMRSELAPIPEKTILFIPDLEKSLVRAQTRDKRKYNQSELSFINSVYSAYKDLSAREIERIEVIELDNGITTEEVISKLEYLLDIQGGEQDDFQR